MAFERSCGVVLFRKEQDSILYLLLHYQAGHWGFPKGHIEKGENLMQTARREVKEETGIEEISLIHGFLKEMEYFFKYGKRPTKKRVTFFLARTESGEVTLSSEHTGYRWLVFEEAEKQLTFPRVREILREADSFIRERAA